MSKQMPKVNCRFGAPMGRNAYGNVSSALARIQLFKVTLTQGYDDGGAYWGMPISYKDTLYCARSYCDLYRQFVRAASREEAREKLGIPQNALARRTVKG